MSTEPRNQSALGTSSGERRKAVVLVNDLAPHAYALNWIEACSQGLGPNVEVSLVRVIGFEAVRKAAAAAAADGVWLILSVGGDGTAFAVINGVGSLPTRICVLPGGTANQLVYNLGQSFNLAENARRLGEYEPIAIDAMRVNGTRFASLTLVGWMGDALIAFNRLRANSFWKRVTRPLGAVMYFAIAFWLLRKSDAIGGPMHISYVDAKDNTTKTIDTDAYLLSIMGPPTINEENTKLVPYSDMADGKMEVLILPRTNRRRLIATLGAMAKGNHLSFPEIQHFQTTKMEITLGRKLDFCVDGEEFPHSDKYVFDIDPAPILMMAPRGRRPGSPKLST